MTGIEQVRARLIERVEIDRRLLESGCVEQVAEAAAVITRSLSADGKVLFFGNGGSSMDAGHLAAELLGRFRKERPSLAAVSLSDSTAAMTAIGNDYAYDEVFARQLSGLGRRGDVAVGLTTSGNSANVVRALEQAAALGLVTIALTGAGGGKVAAVADLCIRVPTEDTADIQEACMHLGHSICELVEAALFP